MPRSSARIVDPITAASTQAQKGSPNAEAEMAKAYPPTAMKPAWPKFNRPV